LIRIEGNPWGRCWNEALNCRYPIDESKAKLANNPLIAIVSAPDQAEQVFGLQ